MEYTFCVEGEPQGKARARVVRLKNGMSSTYTPDKTVLYENWVVLSYQKAKPWNSSRKLEGMLEIDIDAYMKWPKSTSKKKQEAMMRNEIRPTKKPDWDNIGKVVCDALNGIAYGDDSHIVGGRVQKYYRPEGSLEITIREVGDGSS